MAKKKLNYNDAYAEIEAIVDTIEKGNPDVDKLSDMVNRAVELAKFCKEKLKKTDEEINEALENLAD